MGVRESWENHEDVFGGNIGDPPASHSVLCNNRGPGYTPGSTLPLPIPDWPSAGATRGGDQRGWTPDRAPDYPSRMFPGSSRRRQSECSLHWNTGGWDSVRLQLQQGETHRLHTGIRTSNTRLGRGIAGSLYWGEKETGDPSSPGIWRQGSRVSHPTWSYSHIHCTPGQYRGHTEHRGRGGWLPENLVISAVCAECCVC